MKFLEVVGGSGLSDDDAGAADSMEVVAHGAPGGEAMFMPCGQTEVVVEVGGDGFLFGEGWN